VTYSLEATFIFTVSVTSELLTFALSVTHLESWIPFFKF